MFCGEPTELFFSNQFIVSYLITRQDSKVNHDGTLLDGIIRNI